MFLFLWFPDLTLLPDFSFNIFKWKKSWWLNRITKIFFISLFAQNRLWQPTLSPLVRFSSCRNVSFSSFLCTDPRGHWRVVFVYLPPSRAIASRGVSDAVFTVSCLPLGSHWVTVFRPLPLPRRRYVVSLTVIVRSNMFFLFGSSGYFVSPFCPVTRFHRDLLISVLLSAPCGSFSEIPRLFIESRTFPAGLSPPVVVGWDLSLPAVGLATHLRPCAVHVRPPDELRCAPLQSACFFWPGSRPSVVCGSSFF